MFQAPFQVDFDITLECVLVCDLSITGGEPLLRRDVLDILRHAASLGGFNRFILNTSGLFVTEKPAYGRLRRPRSDPERVPHREFARVLDGLRLLARSKLKTGVNFTVTRATIVDFYPTYHRVEEVLPSPAGDSCRILDLVQAKSRFNGAVGGTTRDAGHVLWSRHGPEDPPRPWTTSK